MNQAMFALKAGVFLTYECNRLDLDPQSKSMNIDLNFFAIQK